jgi:hypothetical protein
MNSVQSTPGEGLGHLSTNYLGENRLAKALKRITALRREEHEPNLRRQLAWLGVEPCEVFAIQTLGSTRKCPSYLAFARSVEEATDLTKPGALIGTNRWGKAEPILHQGVYVIGNRLVDRIDELFATGMWQVMPEELITDARVTTRRGFYLDLDTQRTDRMGNPIDLPISATRDELCRTIEQSLQVLHEIVEALGAVGIKRAEDVIAFMMSGNGVQLWFALADIPESVELRDLVKELLAIWAVLYDSMASHVDTAVFDAKRIGPLAGTVKRKGVKEQLHRRVTFDCAADPRRLSHEDLRALLVHYRRLLTNEQRASVAEKLGIRKPQIRQQPLRPASSSGGGGLRMCNQVPIRDVAAKLGVDPEKPVCPGCGSGGAGSDVAFLDDRNLLNCKHNRCSVRPNRTPVDLVAAVAFDCNNLAGTNGVASQVLGWFRTNFGVGGRS